MNAHIHNKDGAIADLTHIVETVLEENAQLRRRIADLETQLAQRDAWARLWKQAAKAHRLSAIFTSCRASTFLGELVQVRRQFHELTAAFDEWWEAEVHP